MRFFRESSGQALILSIMCLGTIMVGVVMFGSKRQEDVSKVSGKLDDAQSAYEALASVGKRVQVMYVNEAGCDPETLNTRLSSMSSLQDQASLLAATNDKRSYAIAQPSLTSHAKYNRCTYSSGCRQVSVPINTWEYIVTVGGVGSDTDARTGDCPRDASVRMHTTVNGVTYVQWVTLTNICGLTSCTGRGFDTFDAGITLTTSMSSSACTGSNNNIPARHYGTGFLKAPDNVDLKLNTNMLRFFRRYLDTGGTDVGDISFLYTTDGVLTNGVCAVSPSDQSASQCKARACLPVLDLNRDGSVNDSDLAVMENFMRGYLTSMPVSELD